MFGFANKPKYSKQSDEQLLTNFRSENWAKLNENNRIAVLQEVENRNATEQGRTPCTVKSATSADDYGCYSSYTNSIEINVNDNIQGPNGLVKNSSYQVLDTIYHEGEHAHQTNCVENQIDPPQGLPQTTRDMCEVENTYGNYKGVIDYNNCTCELDSNNAAVKKVMESKELFQDDPEYGEYLKDREGYFEKAANRDMDEVQNQQAKAVERSYVAGDIDLDKRNEILNNEIGQEQPAFEESKEIYETVKQARLENEQKLSGTVDEPDVDNEPTVDQETEDVSLEANNSEAVGRTEDIDTVDDYDNLEDESEDIGYKRR